MRTSTVHTWIKKQNLAVTASVFFILFLVIGEIGSRIIFSQSYVSPLSNSNYSIASEQLEQLHRYTQSNGTPDCFFFGSSYVLVGIDPEVFGNSFEKQTGNEMNCYNFGLNGSTLSSTGLMARIILETYEPELIVLGVQTHQFIVREETNPFDLAEDRLQYDIRARYLAGDFNFAGWLLVESSFFRTLDRFVPRMFPRYSLRSSEPQPERDPGSQSKPTRPKSPLVISDNGLRPLIYYHDSSPLFQLSNSQKEDDNVGQTTQKTDSRDFEALEKLIEITKDHNTRLVLVEMPISDPSTSNIIDEVASLSHQHGIPFLSTQRLAVLPPSVFVDKTHLHISGNMMFSEWLGTQLGQAYQEEAWSDIESSVWYPVTETWPSPAFLATLGLTDESFLQYLEYTADSSIIPDDALVYSPGEVLLERTFAQSVLGFEADWNSGKRNQKRDQLFQLMFVLGRMRYQTDLNLSVTETEQLQQWWSSLDSSILEELGIQYVLCREELVNPDAEHCPREISNKDEYVLIGSWEYRPLSERYHLYRVVSN